MKNTLYVANLPPSATEAQLRELFGQHGDVTSVEFGVDDRFNVRYALVTMATEKTANKANRGLNGHKLDDHLLAISPPDVDLSKDLMPKQRKAAEALAAELQETEKVPVRQIQAIVQLCGDSFAEAVLKEADEVQARGGLMTSDGERQRTRGGVFFFLARARMAPPARRIVYNRKGKMPPPAEEAPKGETPEQESPAEEG